MSSASLSAVDVIDLVDDDPPTFSLSDHSDSSNHFHITATSHHVFASYNALRNFLDQYAAKCGFEIRYPSNKNTPDEAAHAGTARCWCFPPPPVKQNPDEQQQPSHRPLRRIAPKSANRSGHQRKCGCQWRINFSRHANGNYVFTSTRTLEHTGHELVDVNVLATTIDSLRVIPEAVEQDVRDAIGSGVHGVDSLRRFLSSRHSLNISRQAFSDLVQRTKGELGISDAQADFEALIAWLQREMHQGDAIARIDLVGTTVSGIFYMSAEMVHHSRRNSHVLMMDTTFSTNRFGWPLCLICAVDEHNHTVILAVALIHHQTTEAFEWVLQQLHSAMPDDAWARVACVFTDGDQAMAAALSSTVPHSKHLRCRFHLKQNLRAKLYSAKVDSITSEQCVQDWETAARYETEDEFNAAMAALTTQYDEINHYMHATFPPGQVYADFALNHITTLGVRSTARVESWNAALKGMLEINSRTPMSVLFDSLRYALSDKDQRSFRKAADMAASRPPNSQARTIDADTAPHITYYAQGVVSTQSRLQSNYDLTMVQAANPAIYTVFDRRPLLGGERQRTVTITDSTSTMHCTCGFPTAYLLPCRHVLAVNNHRVGSQFDVTQVDRRWLRSHMPMMSEAVQSLDQSPFDVSVEIPPVPMFSSTLPSSTSASAGRTAIWGQLMGWCTTIVSIATQYVEMRRYISNRIEALCRDAEALVAKPASARSERLAEDESASAAASVELHPTVRLAQMTMPPHRKRKRGNANEKRQQSAVERASKGMRVHLS